MKDVDLPIELMDIDAEFISRRGLENDIGDNLNLLVQDNIDATASPVALGPGDVWDIVSEEDGNFIAQGGFVVFSEGDVQVGSGEWVATGFLTDDDSGTLSDLTITKWEPEE